jgi:hypothetical protein
MKKMLSFLPLGVLLLVNSLYANGQPVRAAPETFQGGAVAAGQAAPALRLPLARFAQRSAGVSGAAKNAFSLPALTDSEVQSLQNVPNEKAFRIGVGRCLPAALSQPMDLSTWDWVAVSGGQVAHFTLSSTGAVRLRAQVQLGQLPAGVELRFYSPTDASAVFGPYTEANSLFWSPTVEGDALGLELFLPTGVPLSSVAISIPQLSHLVVNPASSSLKSSVLKAADYSSCQVDLACASPAWQATGKAVARYVFTETDGLSYMCSGTLLADKDTWTQIPYFFTAAHCINNAQSAANMDMFWLYENSTCGGNDAKPVQTAGGAQMLVTQPSLDTTFLKLNADPPAGTTLSGWTTTPLAGNQTVTGIHHALGYPKKFSQGLFDGHVRVDVSSAGYTVTPDANGDFSQVVWSNGITAPGSSGSGVWIEDAGVHYLNGSLLGGASECSATTAPDDYSRFERIYPFIRSWLDMPGTAPSLRLFDASKPPSALVDGVVIARYLQGTAGTALTAGVTTQGVDMTALEAQLAKVKAVMDVDNDGKADAGKDGLLLVRYLLGLRDAPLVQGVDLSASGRNTPAAVASYLESILNPA